MTIKLAESTGQVSNSAAVEVPSSNTGWLEDLEEVAQLKQQLTQSGSSLPASKPAVTHPAKSSKGYRADRNKVNTILQEAVENPELAGPT